jgi:hypothetical protein
VSNTSSLTQEDRSPIFAARFAIIDEMGFIVGGEQRGNAADMFPRMYWDTALSASDPVLRMLRDVAGIIKFCMEQTFPTCAETSP